MTACSCFKEDEGGYAETMSDTKQTKTIGEHHVSAELARRGWAPALTRDGLERTDILAVLTDKDVPRRMVEIQVKGARGSVMNRISWPLNAKAQQSSLHEREYFVMVAIPDNTQLPSRSFILPRIHVAAAAWIQHMDWLTEPGVPAGKRNAPVDRSRVYLPAFESYENRWDLLHIDENQAPVLLDRRFRELAQDERVGLPPGHPWNDSLPRR